MGKKGVILDNGKTAQSSMALYWKKNRQQSRDHQKKQPVVDEEQQFQKQANSGFEKWKLHKEKIITKNYEKKAKKQEKPEKPVEKQMVQQENHEHEIIEQQPRKDIKILGFKSKDHIKKKLQIQIKKQVDQSKNVLQLPGQLASLSQDDIIQIIRQKNAKRQMASKHRKNVEKQDVILDESWNLQKQKPKKEEMKEEQSAMKEKEQKQEKEEKVQKQERIFKSDVLAELSRGNMDVLKKKQKEYIEVEQVAQKRVEEIEIQKAKKPMFKPRVLDTK